jgi:hypothetical protein
MGTRVAAGGTLIRRYALALTPAGAGIEAAVAAASVPPLSGGTGSHGSEAAHAFTIVRSVGGSGSQPAEGRLPAAPAGEPSPGQTTRRGTGQAGNQVSPGIAARRRTGVKICGWYRA